MKVRTHLLNISDEAKIAIFVKETPRRAYVDYVLNDSRIDRDWENGNDDPVVMQANNWGKGTLYAIFADCRKRGLQLFFRQTINGNAESWQDF